MGADRGKLGDHAAPPGIVECLRDLIIFGPQEPEHSQVAFMMTARSLLKHWLEVIKNPLAEPFEGQMLQLAKHLPV